MLDKFKDMGKLLKQAKEMQGQMKVIQKELKTLRVTEEGEGGKIKITLTGDMDVVDVVIDPSLLSTDHQKKLQNGLKSVMDKAIKKSKDLASSKLAKFLVDLSQGPNQDLESPLAGLVTQFKKLPGVGDKSAQRLAFFICRCQNLMLHSFLMN